MAKRFKSRRAEHKMDDAIASVSVAHEPRSTTILLDSITCDPLAQPRHATEESTIEDYTERMTQTSMRTVVDPEGLEFAPVVLFFDGTTHWLADGFHRVESARRAGCTHFQAHVRPGNLRDAIEFSLSANARHGLRRTREDKRRAIIRALEDSEWGARSDRQIASLCAVAQSTVSRVRQQLVETGDLAQHDVREGKDGRLYRTTPSTKTQQNPEAIERPWRASAKETSVADLKRTPDTRRLCVVEAVLDDDDLGALIQVMGDEDIIAVELARRPSLDIFDMLLFLGEHAELGDPMRYGDGRYVLVAFPHSDRQGAMPSTRHRSFPAFAKRADEVVCISAPRPGRNDLA